VKTCKTKDEYKALVNEAKKKGFDPTYYIGELNSSLTPYPKLSTANTYLMDFPVKMNNQITTLSAVSPIIKKFQGFTFERIMYAYPEELFN
jgi:HD superfamily phosphohydrolase